ncbi:MAG: DUF2802 domain-containing protein [Azonexus sp.]|jgi:hypothetical protein|uniref:DUF2802 domain-containing protein n=1 Tax=Azonexus sp. TaxID=1872668 RepID=UPI00281D8A1B|nr:DUF2802 domain-containing protein [Azonexus sp.]MDR0775881.1 DUF2802 domain-containing protein [Azonexus sp.]
MEIDGWVIGMREGVIVLIALVALYIVVVVLRMLGLRRQPPKTEAAAATELAPLSPAAVASAAPVRELAPLDMPEPPPSAETRQEQATRATAEEFERQRLEREVFQLRDEVDALRGELAALRQDMQQELAHLRAAQAISPIYGEAAQMAAAGYDPAAIAERCGIARAEAELMVALVKNQER